VFRELAPQQVHLQKSVSSSPKWALSRYNMRWTEPHTYGGSQLSLSDVVIFVLMMSLKSALEDLTGTTLKAISGIFAKLEYVSDLRVPSGCYQHWGLARVHGGIAAQQALTEAHRSLVSQLLRTPLRKLLDDAQASSSAKGVLPSAYLGNLYERTAGLLPPNPAAASARHLNSVLHALSSLEASRRHSIPQV
jgi:hypothetical protein